ncbi:unnamed protein product [Brassica oleracea var. botrytis]|uniref:(rape) hypothetical protein n=1 Tax=Brassica napus TaxID=3708 RepID=A0A078INI6_BRANA|nr:unnamed protein product [Brassica napus]CDY50628.1 BnaC01g44300D [Brassica napus]
MLSASTLAYPLSNEGSGLFPVFLQTIFKNKLIAPALVSFSKDICVPDVAFKNRRPERKKLMGQSSSPMNLLLQSCFYDREKSLESENQRSKEAWIVVSFLLDEPWLMKSKRN